MKVLIIQENGRHDKNRRYRECFSLQRAFSYNGCNATVWGLNHENWKDKVDFEKYDIIFNCENYDLTGWLPDLNKTKKPFKILWAIDAHSRTTHPYDEIYSRGKYNLLLHSTLDYVDNATRIWFPNCFDDSLLLPMGISKDFDVGFCGDVSNRGDYLDFLSNQERFTFRKDIFVIGDDMVRAINSYMVHFNKNWGNDINYRNFETIGCGTALLTNQNYQYDILGFKNGENFVTYKGKGDLLDKIQYLLNNHSTRNSIAQKGLSLAKSHTYNHRVEKLLAYLRNKI